MLFLSKLKMISETKTKTNLTFMFSFCGSFLLQGRMLMLWLRINCYSNFPINAFKVWRLCFVFTLITRIIKLFHYLITLYFSAAIYIVVVRKVSTSTIQAKVSKTLSLLGMLNLQAEEENVLWWHVLLAQFDIHKVREKSRLWNLSILNVNFIVQHLGCCWHWWPQPYIFLHTQQPHL